MTLNGEIFSYNLKYLLKINGIRNVELAKHLGVSKSAISNYLSGASVPKLETIARIALYFDVGVDVLLKDYIDKPKPKTKIKEGEPISFAVPLFHKKLLEGDIVFRNDNIQGNIYCPFPVDGNYQCYAFMIYDNNMSDYGITKNSVAIFSPDKTVNNGDVVAVLLKASNTISARIVSETTNEITLICNTGTQCFKKSSKNCEVVILGKIVWVTFNPNKNKRTE